MSKKKTAVWRSFCILLLFAKQANRTLNDKQGAGKQQTYMQIYRNSNKHAQAYQNIKYGISLHENYSSQLW